MATNQLPKNDPEELYRQALTEAINRFHEEGGLWVSGEYMTLDNVYDYVWTSDTYGDWYRENKEAIESNDLERMGDRYRGMIATLLNQGIKQLAEQHLASEKQNAAEDAA
jgi:phage terminase Nu1 subunit (DNA packaging protein)